MLKRLFLSAALGLAGCLPPEAAPPPEGEAARVVRVIDGDTIRLGGTKIRLADIDAPEIFSPKCAAEAALGR